jgi:hypothetical protein
VDTNKLLFYKCIVVSDGNFKKFNILLLIIGINSVKELKWKKMKKDEEKEFTLLFQKFSYTLGGVRFR